MYCTGVDHDIIARLLLRVLVKYSPGDAETIEGSNTIFLSPEEITGEFLGEMKSIEQGVAA